MLEPLEQLPEGKKIYFASDFHLGIPNWEASLVREKKIVSWLRSISPDAYAIVLVGDIFDFWFEYKYVVPKGYVRLLGCLAELKDQGIHLYLFTGNHDMWMFDYLQKEIGAHIIRKPIQFVSRGTKFYVGHGDGLGPGDTVYKIQKQFFDSRFCQWLFAHMPPKWGMWIAQTWSKHSRLANENGKEHFVSLDREMLWHYATEVEKKEHHDIYLFGHRHLVLDEAVGDLARYINTGEWVFGQSYAVFDGEKLEIKSYEG